MTPQLKAVEYSLGSTAPVSVFQPASGMRSLFLGPRGLRAGWRILIFIGLLLVLFGGTVLVRNGGLQGIRDTRKHLGSITMTPLLMGVSEAIAFAILCLATLVMGRLENRKFSEYGLPLDNASSVFPCRINCCPCLTNSGRCCWAGACANRRAREPKTASKVEGIAPMVFMKAIVPPHFER